MNWTADLLLSLDSPARPEFCQVCSDGSTAPVPPLAMTMRDGVRCCFRCAWVWDLDMERNQDVPDRERDSSDDSDKGND